MRKLLALLGLVAVFALLPTVTMAAPPPVSQAVQRVPAWNLVGSYVISFSCATCVAHNITINSYNPYTGVFSGYGVYAANPAYTWTVSGVVTGNQIAMRILYTGQGAGYYVNLIGTITPSGSMSGTATDSSGAQFSWVTSSGHVILYANHGQFVSAQDDKQTAAQSDLGMPIQK